MLGDGAWLFTGRKDCLVLDQRVWLEWPGHVPSTPGSQPVHIILLPCLVQPLSGGLAHPTWSPKTIISKTDQEVILKRSVQHPVVFLQMLSPTGALPARSTALPAARVSRLLAQGPKVQVHHHSQIISTRFVPVEELCSSPRIGSWKQKLPLHLRFVLEPLPKPRFHAFIWHNELKRATGQVYDGEIGRWIRS